MQMDISPNICMHQLLKSQHALPAVCHFILTRLYLSAHACWKAERAKDIKDGLCSSCKMHLKPVSEGENSFVGFLPFYVKISRR